jgi:ssDNA-binding Zn-finger/Zn-ribbon topoisomerase 1
VTLDEMRDLAQKCLGSADLSKSLLAECVLRLMTPAAALPREQEKPLVLIDGRCGCDRCRARTENIYRMIGTCYNCRAKNFLILFRAGDPAAEQDCPTCGKWHSVHPQRLATPDEIPALPREEPQP